MKTEKTINNSQKEQGYSLIFILNASTWKSQGPRTATVKTAGENISSSCWFTFPTHKNTTKAIMDIKDKPVIEEIKRNGKLQ
jgi:hypothetical protein